MECRIFNRDELLPNYKAFDLEGRPVSLWDFRQKSHLALIHEPAGSDWTAAVRKDPKKWEALVVQFLTASEGTVAEGAHVIDRYGRLVRSYPPGQWTLEEIEKDIIYHEACNC